MRRAIVLVAIAVLACRAEKTVKQTAVGKPNKTTITVGQPPAPEPAGASTNVGDAMPAYAAKTLDGAPYDLAKEQGNVVLVNVWATWCGPCRFEIPELQKMHDQYGKRGFKVVGVSVDEGDVKEVKQFAAEQKMTYPVVVDPDGRIANVLATTVLPTSVLLDRHGKIVWREIGAIDPGDQTLTTAIEKALGGGGRAR